MTALSAKQKILIVGSGDYVKNLSRFKYEQYGACEIDCIVSPHASSKSWINCNKLNEVEKITKEHRDHVFDLSVFPKNIVPTLQHVLSIGAKKIILPKPVSESRLDYFLLEELLKKHKCIPLVSSQWFYSTMFDNYQEPQKIVVDFRKSLPKTYNFYNSFLPHIIQILNKMNVKVKYFLGSETKDELKINLLDRQGTLSIKNEDSNKRCVEITINGKDVKFDLTAAHRDGKILTYPKIKTKTQKQYKEDIMSKMIKAQLEHFDGRDVDVLDFNGYKEIQNSIFEIIHRVEK